MILQALIFSLLLTYCSITVCRRLGLMDVPGGRKDHAGDIPLAGGIAIFLTVVLISVTQQVTVFSEQLLWVAALLFLIGVIDDALHINPWLRLGVHYFCGILMATAAGIAIIQVGDLLTFGTIELLLLCVPLTALAAAGLCNAFNMIDGLDGLAAGLVLIPLLLLAFLAWQAGHPMLPALLIIAVPVMVFLLFNLGPNRVWLPQIFLGDAGSVTLGFLLTAALVTLSQGQAALIAPVTALWLVTVPLMDMLATMLRRMRQGRSPLHPDRLHLHYALLDAGFSPRQVLLLLLAYALCCAGLGLVLEALPASVSLLLYHLMFLLHCLFVTRGLERICATHEPA
ncbi:undecaprenyl/decaprenyl-phosphate alpha-N-acetylglucosaminyl 1-phosphate transferase [Halieaceae bacterium IMCC14734]|uniref:Undecaprenyl/decaprenyl-phosphate alpha-N-acetylglucosaminyl 1-phosphate transferase n=1 Tax=Candidatus Litorirhabdus singularis TaxID=2518993 RepID=A0ABT3TDP3_9GAMM|nr:MraY family glycosyltransferase [Candidatus Litorirhabdus singularis]MCX2980379.1 undecaprenyl/decaprenyl-phosphate alpha-N-acetylglucosaminyl 1-phosphate transferase [Candidatus Litorirhabdus singularis]